MDNATLQRIKKETNESLIMCMRALTKARGDEKEAIKLLKYNLISRLGIIS